MRNSGTKKHYNRDTMSRPRLIWLACICALGCLASLLITTLLLSANTYADSNKCRTMIYRSDTAGYDSPYVQVCADVNDNGEIVGNISVSENKRTFLGVKVTKFDGGNGIAENIRICQRTGFDDCEGGTYQYYYAGNGPSSSDSVHTGLTNFNDFTNGVLYAVSDIAGGEKTEEVQITNVDGSVYDQKIKYIYNGIYDGSYSDWENAGYPDENGNTYDENSTTDNTEETSSENSDSDPCYDATSSLGWLVCPVISWVGGVMGDLYSGVVEPFLQIDSSLVDTSDSGTYGAWSAFRDIANIIFVILVIVVILSQVTGFGISNYGIKKALPKIIVVAILVNLSYVLCQLAVDVSNILGFSLKSFLTNIASGLPESAANAGDTNNPVVSFGVTGAVSIAIGVAAFKVGGGALAITLLLSIIAALISLIFMFIVLGIRQAGIVLLIALAPVAIVCYALPNTERLAKRWLNMFKALLMIYPIAGLLIGGCTVASKILLQAADGTTLTGLLIEIIAMLLMVVPFFMLPSLLKKSIAGADQIFGSIVNKGEGLTGAAQGKVRNSQMMQRNQAKVASRRQLAGTRTRVGAASLASKTLGRVSKSPGVGGRLAAAGQRGILNAYAGDMRKMAEVDTENLQDYLGTMINSDTGGYDNNKISKERDRIAEKAKNGERLSRTEQKTWQAIADHYAKTGDAAGLVAMGRGGSQATRSLLSQRAQANHGIIDVMGGDKGDKALAEVMEKKGGDMAQIDYAGAMAGRSAKDIANQDADARDKMLNSITSADNLLPYLNNGALNGARSDGRQAFENRAKILGLQRSNTGTWYKPRSQSS